MNIIKIPFNDWSKDKLRAKLKVGTTRNIKYGEAGDTFSEIGNIYKFTYIKRMTLAEVAYVHHTAEGCKTPAEFLKVWEDIHPNKEVDLNQLVYFHKFENIKKEQSPKTMPELKDAQRTLEVVK